MTNSEKTFIKLLSDYINKIEERVSPDNETLSEIAKLASIHNVEGIIYTRLDHIENETTAKLKNTFLKKTYYSLLQEKEAEKTLDILNTAKIPHLLTKGYIVKNCYPDKELRTMGDIDILVKPEDFERTKIELTEKGYVNTSSYFHEETYKLNGFLYEIHDNLMMSDLEIGFDYVKYYENIFDKASVKDKFTYALTLEDHFIYLLAHIAKHFYGEGCGIRMIMDIAVYYSFHKEKLNAAYILSELDYIKLKKLANNIFYLCQKWFNTDFAFEVTPMSDELYKEISKYVLEGGVFGFYRSATAAKILRTNHGVNKGKNASVYANLLRYIFPSVKDTRQSCSWFKNKPVVLLPIAWIIRIIEANNQRHINPFIRFSELLKNRSEAKKQKRLLTELGLYSAASVKSKH